MVVAVIAAVVILVVVVVFTLRLFPERFFRKRWRVGTRWRFLRNALLWREKVFAVQVECLFSITLFGQRVELVKMYFLLSVVARKLWVQCWPPTLLANSQFAIRCWQKILFNVFLTHEKCCSQCLSFIGWRRALISRQTDVVVASRKRLYSTAMMTTLTTDASPSLKVDVAQNCSRGQNQILPFENHPEELQLSLRWQQKTVKLSHLLIIQNVFFLTKRAVLYML